MPRLRVLFIFLFIPLLLCIVLLSCLPLQAQEVSNGNRIYLTNQQVIVRNLPPLVASSTDGSAALATGLEIVLHDKTVCCGKDSALEDTALWISLANSVSLKALTAKVLGRHLLSDGRPIVVTADFVPPDSINAGFLVNSLTDQHAMLLQWNSRVYVLYGAIFDETRDPGDGSRVDSIHKLLLLDPGFSGPHRTTEFNRDTDDWSKVEGLSILKVVPQ